ncbi:GD11729 [Drosophila simulans]|uniref:GD11729 n=1 Tax=Drosophila simulans TaxID=7240 RepID=B4QI41_DROSI|nr:GD11729 [Drosophila simulans]
MRQAASDNNENRKKRRWQLATAADCEGGTEGGCSTGGGGADPRSQTPQSQSRHRVRRTVPINTLEDHKARHRRSAPLQHCTTSTSTSVSPPSTSVSPATATATSTSHRCNHAPPARQQRQASDASASSSAGHHRFGPEIHSRRGLSQAMANAQYQIPTGPYPQTKVR